MGGRWAFALGDGGCPVGGASDSSRSKDRRFESRLRSGAQETSCERAFPSQKCCADSLSVCLPPPPPPISLCLMSARVIDPTVFKNEARVMKYKKAT